jgi:hypothetical protein
MAAVVLDHEEAHKEAGGRHSEEQANPVAGLDGSPYRHP